MSENKSFASESLYFSGSESMNVPSDTLYRLPVILLFVYQAECPYRQTHHRLSMATESLPERKTIPDKDAFLDSCHRFRQCARIET